MTLIWKLSVTGRHCVKLLRGIMLSYSQLQRIILIKNLTKVILLSLQESILVKVLLPMFVMELLSFYFLPIKKLKNSGNTLFSKFFRCLILMESFMETTDQIFLDSTLINVGRILLKTFILKFITLKKWYRIFFLKIEFIFIVTFMDILWKKMLSFMAHMIKWTQDRVNNSHF